MEFPLLCARAGIVSARVARLAGSGNLTGIGADDQSVLVNHRRRIVRNGKVYFTLFAEAGIELAGVRVQPHDPPPHGYEYARRIIRIAGPVSDSAARWSAVGRLIYPELLARFRLERHHGLRRGQIHHALYHDWCDFPAARDTSGVAKLSDFERPGRTEPGDVSRIDLRQRRIAVRRKVAVEHRPFGRRWRFGLLCVERDCQNGEKACSKNSQHLEPFYKLSLSTRTTQEPWSDADR